MRTAGQMLKLMGKGEDIEFCSLFFLPKNEMWRGLVLRSGGNHGWQKSPMICLNMLVIGLITSRDLSTPIFGR